MTEPLMLTYQMGCPICTVVLTAEGVDWDALYESVADRMIDHLTRHGHTPEIMVDMLAKDRNQTVEEVMDDDRNRY